MSLTLLLTLVGTTILLRATKIDARKDERTIQLMVLSGRNAFFFLLFAMPALATLVIAGVVMVDAFAALMLLWIVALAITWISFFYYYTK
ncbi:MAG: hypothetical protein JW779_16245 [Candidatus Thorarchaeota archaeon]|nr:hypothetical protein [Candidatus Thorarchaeota archaeon]